MLPVFFSPQVPVRVAHIDYKLHVLVGSDNSIHLSVVSAATYLRYVNTK